MAPATGSFYLASSLENAEEAKDIASLLKNAGWTHTYDWTLHGSVQKDGEERIRQVALLEMSGVHRAQVIVVVLPGGPGTHVEMGAALAYNKPIVLYAKEDSLYYAHKNRLVAFYKHPNVKMTTDREAILPLCAAGLVASKAPGNFWTIQDNTGH